MLACLKARALAAAIGCSASAAVVLMAPNREQKDQKLRQAVVLTREAHVAAITRELASVPLGQSRAAPAQPAQPDGFGKAVARRGNGV